MIIVRYLTREVFQSLLSIMAILLLIVVCNMFVHYLGVAAAGAMSGLAVVKLIGLTLPRYVAILLPISLFLAILLVYGRLFATKELLVLFACGMTWLRLLWISLLPALLVMGCVGFLTLYVMPKMSVHQQNVTRAAAAKDNITLLQSGRFIPLQGNSQVIYLGSLDATTAQVQDLFLFRNPGNGQAPQIVMAPRGHQMVDPKTLQHYVVLNDGYVYKAMPGALNYQVIHFDSYAVRMSTPALQGASKALDSVSTLSLVKGAVNTPVDRKEALSQQAELQWRFSLPIAVIVLTVLGVAFCYVGPRQGRYIKLIPAILVFIVYFNLVTLSRSWIEQGTIAPWLGLWWVHGLFLVLGLLWLWRADDFIVRWRAR